MLVWIGDRSYALYLWHWPILMLAYSFGIQNNLIAMTSLLLLSLLFAMLSYRWVELPFWKGRLSHAPVKQTILISILLMVITGSGILKLMNLIHSQYEKNSLPKITQINKARHDLPIIYKYGCDTWYTNADIKPCLIGRSDAPKTVVLLGDSIGAQWFSILPLIFKSPQWRIEVLTKSACAMVDVDYFYPRIGKIYDVCTQWRNEAIKYLSKVKPDIIFVGSAGDYKFTKEQWVNGSRRVFAQLSKAVTNQVFIIPGTPKLSFDGPSCLEKNFGESTTNILTSNNKSCQEVLLNKQTAHVSKYLEKATKELHNVDLLKLNKLVCLKGACTAKNSNGTIVFRDNQHLTDTFVREQVPSIVEMIKLFKIEGL